MTLFYSLHILLCFSGAKFTDGVTGSAFYYGMCSYLWSCAFTSVRICRLVIVTTVIIWTLYMMMICKNLTVGKLLMVTFPADTLLLKSLLSCDSCTDNSSECCYFKQNARPIYTVSQKNNTDVAHYNFNAHQPILVILGTNVAERACYQNDNLLTHFPNYCLHTTWENVNPEIVSVHSYRTSKTWVDWHAHSRVNSVLLRVYVQDYSSMPAGSAQVMAHEMGHNFAFEHDDEITAAASCTCHDPSGHCVMYSRTRSAN